MRHSSFLEIDLNLLGQNFKAIQTKAPKAELIPMVKADAYGNGMVPVAQYLTEICGAKKLGCATLGEALRLFEEIPDLRAEVLVFSESNIQDENLRRHYFSQDITPVLHQVSDVNTFLLENGFRDTPLVLKVNTGMNRLGVSLEELKEIAPRLKSRGVDHLMTHLATSYYEFKKGDKTERQLEAFEKAKKILNDAGVEIRGTSVSNSGAIEQAIGCEETFVRPGLMLYGPYSVDENHWKGSQVSRLVTHVLKTFSVKKGTPVGYGVNVAPEDGFIAVLPLGYGDGVPTFASGTELTVRGFKARIFARVNMDMCFLFFSAEVEGKIKVGDEVEFWNHDNRVISDIATQMKTIPYQLMCGISGRIPKIYKVK